MITIVHLVYTYIVHVRVLITMDPPDLNIMKWVLLSVWFARMCLVVVIIIGVSLAIGLNHEDDGSPINYPCVYHTFSYTQA